MNKLRWPIGLLLATVLLTAGELLHRRLFASGAVPDTSAFTIRGVDLSVHNGTVDFSRLREQGYEFVILKASEGCDHKDRRFAHNYRAARRAGLKVGAYHFFRFDRDGHRQALNLMESLHGHPVHLPLIIDVEEYRNAANQPTDSIVGRLRNMITHLERRGHRVMIYTNKTGHKRFISGRFDDYPLWLSCLVTPRGKLPPLWQYTYRGRLDGIKGDVDLNVFTGSDAEWEQWLTDTDAINDARFRY